MERQTSSLGGKTVISKHVKFNKTDMNGREINTMVKRAVTVALKGGGTERTLGVASNTNVSRDEGRDFGIDPINLAYTECHSEQSNRRKATTIKKFTSNNKN